MHFTQRCSHTSFNTAHDLRSTQPAPSTPNSPMPSTQHKMSQSPIPFKKFASNWDSTCPLLTQYPQNKLSAQFEDVGSECVQGNSKGEGTLMGQGFCPL